MKKVDYLFDRSSLLNINYQALLDFKVSYLKLLEDNPFPIPPKSGSFYEMIKYLKRKDEALPLKIGSYGNITPFEAANRIASDLVIINGLIQLVEKHKELKEATFTLRLGTTHMVGNGDFTISVNNEDMEGEAFNVAPSFLKPKLRSTKIKWNKSEELNSRLKYILVNEEAFEFIGTSKINERVFKVTNWHL